MKFIYDHLSASLLSVAIFFILVAVQMRSGETTQDQTRYYSAKTHLLEAKEMIEHDFANIGAGVARFDPVFITKNDSTLEFMALVEPTDTDPSKITYRRVSTQVIEIEGEEVQLYEVERLIDDVLTGKSPDTLREFEINLWNDARQVTGTFNDVAAVNVRLVIAPPLGGDDDLHAARWNRTFWPSNLSNF